MHKNKQRLGIYHESDISDALEGDPMGDGVEKSGEAVSVL